MRGAKPVAAMQAVRCCDLELSKEKAGSAARAVWEAEKYAQKYPGAKGEAKLAAAKEYAAASNAEVESNAARAARHGGEGCPHRLRSSVNELAQRPHGIDGLIGM